MDNKSLHAQNLGTEAVLSIFNFGIPVCTVL